MNLERFDPITRREILFFIERKEAEFDKLSGQIARDLRRIGEDAFRVADNYTKLARKYRNARAGTKKLLILEMMKEKWAEVEQ